MKVTTRKFAVPKRVGKYEAAYKLLRAQTKPEDAVVTGPYDNRKKAVAGRVCFYQWAKKQNIPITIHMFLDEQEDAWMLHICRKDVLNGV